MTLFTTLKNIVSIATFGAILLSVTFAPAGYTYLMLA